MKRYVDTYKNILHLAIPVMLSQLGQVTVQLADNMMVGWVGKTELAAASFANSIFVLGMMLGAGTCMGLTPLIGKAYLNEDNDKMASLLKNAKVLNQILGLFIISVLLLAYFFLDKMGQPEEVVKLARPYFLVLTASILPLYSFSTYKQFLEGIGNTKIAMIITITSNILNVLFNYILIYGKFGIPSMGLLGAGISTLISRIFMAITLSIYVNKEKEFKLISNLTKKMKLKISEFKSLLNVGVPIGLQIVFEILIFSVSGIMMGWIGEDELAAHQITLCLTTIAYMVSLGVGTATTIKVSHALGSNNIREIKKLTWGTIHITISIMCTMGIVFIFMKDKLPLLFNNNPEVVSIASSLLIVTAMFQVFDSLQVALLASLRGIADVKIPMILALISYIFIGMSTCYFLAFKMNMGPIGIWIGLLIGLAVASLLFAFRLRYKLKRLNNLTSLAYSLNSKK